MRLLLFHPGAAAIECDDCQKYIYDVKSGQRRTYRAGAARVELPCIRPAAVPTPCGECAKKNPEEARRLKLSARNQRTLWLYRQVRATGGRCISAEAWRDGLLIQNVTLLDELFREHQRQQLGEEIARQMTLLYQR